MVIGISGNIASGKSTLSKALHKHYKTSMVIEEFKDDDPVFNTFLRWIYEQKPNIDIGFQSYIVESLTDNFKRLNNKFLETRNHQNDLLILDRFVLEHYVFAVANLEKKEKKYLEAFNALFEEILDLEANPDLAIYLDMTFETFKKHLFKRNREVETSNWDANYNYFKRLHELYKDVFIEVVEKFQIPYYIIDVNNLTSKEVTEKAIAIIDNHDFSTSKRMKWKNTN
ncbi:Deoxyguanosine kinase [Mycoplasmopsis californica]|uniref:Deoxynucleoside kinase n=1 Tax=Mycoplasmopsis equigenitalium TaxID=114883 RepID=A0ABY5J229_9BACT|nr:deoxynucleoside kinase [Mycoplasmopsis equigenitalium]UUD37279.1 deoxynucleoside kinase [Mycoplasmopsis equigenitalium]VEU69412.1 Deoxyguanosine kinase [Mycoplasmopsis californica]